MDGDMNGGVMNKSKKRSRSEDTEKSSKSKTKTKTKQTQTSLEQSITENNTNNAVNDNEDSEVKTRTKKKKHSSKTKISKQTSRPNSASDLNGQDDQALKYNYAAIVDELTTIHAKVAEEVERPTNSSLVADFEISSASVAYSKVETEDVSVARGRSTTLRDHPRRSSSKSKEKFESNQANGFNNINNYDPSVKPVHQQENNEDLKPIKRKSKSKSKSRSKAAVVNHFDGYDNDYNYLGEQGVTPFKDDKENPEVQLKADVHESDSLIMTRYSTPDDDNTLNNGYLLPKQKKDFLIEKQSVARPAHLLPAYEKEQLVESLWLNVDQTQRQTRNRTLKMHEDVLSVPKTTKSFLSSSENQQNKITPSKSSSKTSVRPTVSLKSPKDRQNKATAETIKEQQPPSSAENFVAGESRQSFHSKVAEFELSHNDNVQTSSNPQPSLLRVKPSRKNPSFVDFSDEDKEKWNALFNYDSLQDEQIGGLNSDQLVVKVPSRTSGRTSSNTFERTSSLPPPKTRMSLYNPKPSPTPAYTDFPTNTGFNSNNRHTISGDLKSFNPTVHKLTKTKLVSSLPELRMIRENENLSSLRRRAFVRIREIIKRLTVTEETEARNRAKEFLSRSFGDFSVNNDDVNLYKVNVSNEGPIVVNLPYTNDFVLDVEAKIMGRNYLSSSSDDEADDVETLEIVEELAYPTANIAQGEDDDILPKVENTRNDLKFEPRNTERFVTTYVVERNDEQLTGIGSKLQEIDVVKSSVIYRKPTITLSSVKKGPASTSTESITISLKNTADSLQKQQAKGRQCLVILFSEDEAVVSDKLYCTEKTVYIPKKTELKARKLVKNSKNDNSISEVPRKIVSYHCDVPGYGSSDPVSKKVDSLEPEVILITETIPLSASTAAMPLTVVPNDIPAPKPPFVPPSPKRSSPTEALMLDTFELQQYNLMVYEYREPSQAARERELLKIRRRLGLRTHKSLEHLDRRSSTESTNFNSGGFRVARLHEFNPDVPVEVLSTNTVHIS